METSLTTQKLDFLDELDSLSLLAKEMGEDHRCYEKLVSSIEYLHQFKYVFVYAEYVNDCVERTPKCVRDLTRIIFRHKDVKQIDF